MQSRLAYILGSFVIPEGATSGTRIEFDAELGLILVYDAADNLIASIAPDQGTTPGGTFYARGIASYGGVSGLIAILTNSGSLRFQAKPTNNPFLSDAEVIAGNPGVASPQNRASLAFYAPQTRAGSGTAYIDMQSASADNTKKGLIHYGFSDPDTEGTHGFVGIVYAERWAGNTQVREVWNPITLPGAWVATQPCSYRMTPDGFIQLRGIAQANAAIAAGTVITTLPAGYRPGQTLYQPMVYDGAAGIGRALIRPTGAIELYEAASLFPCLDSIRFPVSALV